MLDLAPSPLNPLGVKGGGEIGIVATGAALANAVSSALAPLGVQVHDLPLSPDRIRRRCGRRGVGRVQGVVENFPLYEVIETATFARWVGRLRDQNALVA